MLAIKIEEEWIDLAPGAAMSITLNNPAFDPERIGRTYSYPVRLQHTPRNLFTTKNRHRIDSQRPTRYLDAKAYIQDQLFEEGRLLFTEATESETEASFQNISLSLADTLGDMKLHDILSVIDIPETYKSRYVFETNGAPPYELPVNGDNYIGTGGTASDALANLADNINAVYPGIATADPEFITIEHNEPDIFLGTTVSLTLVEGRTLGDAHFLNMDEYIAAAALDDTYPVAFPVVHVPNLYGNLNPAFEGYANYRLAGTMLANENIANNDRWKNTVIPFFRVRHILDRIAAEAGIVDIIFDLAAAEATDMNALLVWNNYALDEVYFNQNFGEDDYKNGFAEQISPANHVPDISALNFLNRIAKGFNFHFRYREERLFFTPNLRQIENPEADWTPFTQPFYERTFITGLGVTLTFEDAPEPIYLTQLEDYVLGEGFNTHEIPFRPVHHITIYNSLGTANLKTAYYQQAGISEPLGLDNEQDTFRLFFDRGQQLDAKGNAYWLACHDNTNYAATEVGALSLDFPGANGLYASFWKNWVEMLYKPTITRLIALPVSELVNMRAWTKSKVYIFDNQGSATCVVRSIQFKASAKGLGIAQVEMQML